MVLTDAGEVRDRERDVPWFRLPQGPCRLAALAGAIEWVLAMQQRESAREATEDGKKHAHRRFNDAVLALSRAFALAAASDEAREIRDEVGFFQTVRAALAKTAPGAGKSSAERDLAVQQIVSRAVVSTEIVDGCEFSMAVMLWS